MPLLPEEIATKCVKFNTTIQTQYKNKMIAQNKLMAQSSSSSQASMKKALFMNRF